MDTEAIEIMAATTNTITKLRIIMSGKKWEHEERDSKITLLHELSHFIPEKFGESFFRQFNLAKQLRKEVLKKQGKVEAEVSEVMEERHHHCFLCHKGPYAGSNQNPGNWRKD